MRRMRQYFSMVVASAALMSIAYVPSAGAGLIGTDEALSSSQSSSERDRVTALLTRPELAKELQAFGLPAENAQARVDALTDQEVRALAARLDQLPAAGNFSDFQWVMIVIGIVIIALLL